MIEKSAINITKLVVYFLLKCQDNEVTINPKEYCELKGQVKIRIDEKGNLTFTLESPLPKLMTE